MENGLNSGSWSQRPNCLATYLGNRDIRNAENKLGGRIDVQSTGLFIFHSTTLCVTQIKIVMGKIKCGSIFVNGIIEWCWFLLTSDFSPNLTAGTEKNPDEHDSKCSLCWPWFVPGASLKQTKRFTYWAKCITIVRDIDGMCINIGLHTWMIQEYGIIATLRILLRDSLFES